MINNYIKRIKLATFSLVDLKNKIEKWTLGDRNKTEIRNDSEFIPLLQEHIQPVENTYYRLVDSKEFYSILKNKQISYKLVSVTDSLKSLAEYVAPIFPKRQYILKIICKAYPIYEYANINYKKQKESLIVNQTLKLIDSPKQINMEINTIGYGKIKQTYNIITLK